MARYRRKRGCWFIGRNKFSKDLAKQIYGLLEADMDARWNSAHDFPQELEPVIRKLQKGLGMNLMRDETAVEVYRWIKEQDEAGKPIEKFIEWALADEQRKFISKYRFNPGLIKNEMLSTAVIRTRESTLPSVKTLVRFSTSSSLSKRSLAN